MVVPILADPPIPVFEQPVEICLALNITVVLVISVSEPQVAVLVPNPSDKVGVSKHQQTVAMSMPNDPTAWVSCTVVDGLMERGPVLDRTVTNIVVAFFICHLDAAPVWRAGKTSFPGISVTLGCMVLDSSAEQQLVTTHLAC